MIDELPASSARAVNPGGVSQGGDFPDDPTLPGTQFLRRPGQLAEALSQLTSDWTGSEARVRRVVIRRHLPGKRCVAQISLDDSRRLLLKLYPDDRGMAVYTTLEQLRSHGFATAPLTVPRPLVWDPVRRLLIQEWANGESLRGMLLGGRCSSGAIDRAAQWLLKLHACGAQGGRRYDFDRHLHTLTLQGEFLAQAFPEVGKRYWNVLRIVENRGRALSGWTSTPTHRDFTPEHLFFDGEHVTGLDFDEFCQYDPLFDVAHFLAHLRLLALNSAPGSNQFHYWAMRFYASYKARARDYSAERIRLYQAVAYLKLAWVVGSADRPESRERLVTALIHEAQHFV